MKIFGQIEDACLEQLSVDPVENTQGRIFTNTTDGKTKIDSGTKKVPVLQNDENIVIGNNNVVANNVRLHKASGSVLQPVIASDTTADGSPSSNLAQISARIENFTFALLPSYGNVGRVVYVIDRGFLYVDIGTAWVQQTDGPTVTSLSTPSEYDAGNSGSAKALDFVANGAIQKITMTSNCTFSFSTNPVAGTVLLLKLVQDATGGRTYAWPGGVKWGIMLAPVASTANKTDLVNLYYDGTNYYGTWALGF